jgi:branched-chain amino acid transport system ATP-binding protein
MTAELRLQQVSAFYGASQILHEIDLSVPAGGVSCLVGLNGMGKTTCLRAIMGLVAKVEGVTSIDGRPLVGPAYARARRGITLVPEDRKVFASLTVRENLAVGESAGGSRRGFCLSDALALFPRLQERLDQKGGTLSGGEQQMLVMARAMLANPRYLLLDEPSEGLAPFYVEVIRDAILATRERGVGVLLVEQSISLACAVGDTFHVMENGELIHAANRDDVERDPTLLEKMLTVE